MADAYNPFENRDVAKPITTIEALGHLLKGCIGSGVLGMPKAYYLSGLWFGLICTIVVGSFVTYGVYILVESAHVLCFRHQIPSLHYDEIGDVAFQYGPTERIRKSCKLMKFAINFMLVVDLFGCCAVYVVFVAKNIKQVCDQHFEYVLLVRTYILILIPFFLIYVTIRTLKVLAPLSILADLLIVVGLSITIYYIFTDVPNITDRPFFGKPEHFPLFFGIVIFALEGIGVIMPLENQMKNPVQLIHKPGVLFIGMGTTAFLFAAVGFLGYWKFGDVVEESITLSLPEDKIPGQLVKSMFAIALFQTYGLQFYVPFEIVWRKHVGMYGNKGLLYEILCRYAITIAICLSAYAVPSICQIMSLIGAFALACMGMIFPGVIHLVTFYEEPGYGKYKWRLIMDSILLILGIAGFLTGTISAFMDIIYNFNYEL